MSSEPYDARHPGGAPSRYRTEFCESAAQLARGGATDEEIAQALGVHAATLYRWYAAHPELREAVKLGKDAADDRVERALYHRAVGYSHEAVKIMQHDGAPVLVRYIEHVPPDPGALMNWLTNRRLFHDPTCLLARGDHPFIQHESYVCYAHCRIEAGEAVSRLIEKGCLFAKEPVSDALLARIIAGIGLSKFVKRFAREFLADFDASRSPAKRP